MRCNFPLDLRTGGVAHARIICDPRCTTVSRPALTCPGRSGGSGGLGTPQDVNHMPAINNTIRVNAERLECRLNDPELKNVFAEILILNDVGKHLLNICRIDDLVFWFKVRP